MLIRALAAAAIIQIVATSWLDGDDNIDRPGGDMLKAPIHLSANDPPDKCAMLCLETSDCVAWAYCKRARCDPKVALCYLKNTITPQSWNTTMISGVKNAQLLPPAFVPLAVGRVRPSGWLLEQLTIQAEGLSGYLSLFWDDVMNSSWIGGVGDTGLHERTPYWLNGFVPLAYQLNNATLIDMAVRYIDYILNHQASNGWLGPDDDEIDGNMYWSKFPILLSLTQYYEATGDDRIIPAMFKFLKEAQRRMFNITTPLQVWSASRWQDLVLSIHWLLDNYPAEEQFLWDLAELAHNQGNDWKDWFSPSNFPTGPVTYSETSQYTHGVNNGQAIKSEGVWYRQSHDITDWNSSYVRMDLMEQYHGQASGIFGCDEHLAGNMPSRGTELCTVVETMFSYEVLFDIQGDCAFAEKAEQITYNALPATLTSDMWAHQYLQQGNEMNAVWSDDHIWATDGPDATEYGLQPNFGCCTANFNQGWPKFVQHMVVASSDGKSIAVAMYGPVQVDWFNLPTSGVSVKLEITTSYPFDEHVGVVVTCTSDIGVKFRVPSWAKGATVSVNGTFPQSAPPGALYLTPCSGTTEYQLYFPMAIIVQRRYNNAVSIYRGPLLYALSMVENFTVLESYAFHSKDYMVLPGTPWNYALLLTDDVMFGNELQYVETGLQPNVPPFSQKGAPGMILAKGRLVDTWNLEHNAAAPPPQSPVLTSRPLTNITLIPYGATKLRIAEMPTTLV